MAFESVCVSVQGASHIKNGMPREDCGATAHGSFYDVFAVADGHGDSNCPRSDLGSRFACDIAIEHLRSFAQSLRVTEVSDLTGGANAWSDEDAAWMNCGITEASENATSLNDNQPESGYRDAQQTGIWVDDEPPVPACSSEPVSAPFPYMTAAEPEASWESKLASTEAEQLVRQLVRSIVAHWNEEVADHYATHPLTPEERAGCDRYLERYDRGERIEHIYGTTLIAGLISDTYLLLLQQGDGRCVLFDAEGNALQPIPWDDRCVANVCTSLCDTDAVESCRYYFATREDLPVVACLAGSDGVEDSFFSMEQMESYYRELLCYAAEKGVPALGAHLERTLPDFSARGSQDDVTICGLIDPMRVTALVDVFQRRNELIAIRSQRDRIADRLRSMSGKMDYLQQRFSAASARVKQVQAQVDQLSTDQRMYRSELNSMQPRTIRLFDVPIVGFQIVLEEGHAKLWSRDTKRRLAQTEDELEKMRKALDEAQQELRIAEHELQEYRDRRDSFNQALAEQDARMRELDASSEAAFDVSARPMDHSDAPRVH